MTDTIEKIVQNYIEKYHMLDAARNIAAGVSGGPDSMCMLHILWKLREKYGYRLAAVHVHHGIRGREADEDMEYVRTCCEKWGIEFYPFCFPVEELARKWHMSPEEAGRKVRYQCFFEILEKLGGGKAAVAHNRDDSSETFLFHLFRGTGIQGLTGIPPVRQEIIRPVLCLERTQILEYLEKNGIDYRTDRTNKEELYTRNKIRNRVMPYVNEHINARASEHIFQAADSFREICDYMDRQTDIVYRDAVEEKDGVYAVCIDKTSDKVLLKMMFRRIIEALAGSLKDVTAAHIDIVLDIMAGKTGKRANLPYHIVCEKQYDRLLLYQQDPKDADCEPFCRDCAVDESKEEQVIVLPENRGSLCIKLVKNVIRNKKFQEKMYTKWLDYDILTSTFQIRTRRAGDYIVINRQGGRKKLKDYFINLKIPRKERDHILLLAKGNEVFWIIGYRVSERCRAFWDTENIAKIEYLANQQVSDRQE